jgi:hypothetical protein
MATPLESCFSHQQADAEKLGEERKHKQGSSKGQSVASELFQFAFSIRKILIHLRAQLRH